MKRTIYLVLFAASGVLLALVGWVAAQPPARLPEAIEIANRAALPQDNAALAAFATDPVLFLSDLTSGPKTGNGDTSGGRSGQDGAIVTLWGRNLGSAQGSSKVYANGAEAASYYYWGDATAPADLYASHKMQRWD